MADNRSDQSYRSRWPRYVLIYLLGAAVVYGLVYLIFFTDGGGGGGIY
jgi:hypothetical protein